MFEEKDYVTKQMFDDLLKDEEGHIDFLEIQIAMLGNIGEERSALLNARSADKADAPQE